MRKRHTLSTDRIRDAISHLNSIQAHATSRQQTYDRVRISIILGISGANVAITSFLIRFTDADFDFVIASLIFGFLNAILLNAFYHKRSRIYHDVITFIQIKKKFILEKEYFNASTFYSTEEIFSEKRREGRVRYLGITFSKYSKPDAPSIILIVSSVIITISYGFLDLKSNEESSYSKPEFHFADYY